VADAALVGLPHPLLGEVPAALVQMRGGVVTVETSSDALAPSFLIRAQGASARVTDEVAQALAGDAVNVDARHVQPFLTHKLSRSVNTALSIVPMDSMVELKAG